MDGSVSGVEERRLVQAVQERVGQERLRSGQQYYVLNSKWWSLWQQYVQWGAKEGKHEGQHYTQRPGPIDNEALLEDKKKRTIDEEESETQPPGTPEGEDQEAQSEEEDKEVVKVLRMGLDKLEYELVPEETWKMLHSWYGGGPAIPRSVITTGVTMKPIVELYPLSLRTLRGALPMSASATIKDQDQTFLFSRNATIKEVVRVIAGHCYVPPHKCTLFLVEGDSNPVSLADSLGKTLEALGIEDGQTIMLKYHSDMSREDSLGSSRSNASSFPVFVKVTNKEGPPIATGVTGLYNLGNTCFLNSIVQCLSNSHQLSQYFISDAYTADLNHTNPLGTKGELAREFAFLLKEIWSGKYLYVVPRDFKRILGNFAPQFNGYQQHDSQELLAYLLDGLHEDLNYAVKNGSPPVSPQEGEKLEHQRADDAWESYLRRSRSFIVDLFQGQLKSTLVCSECSQTSIIFEPFTNISLPIPTINTRIVEVVFFPRSGRPVKYGVRVPKLGEIRDLKESLAKLVGRSPKEILLADVFSYRAFFLDDWKYLFDTIRQSDIIYGYEVLAPKENSTLEVKEHKQQTEVMCAGSFDGDNINGDSKIDDQFSNNTKPGTGVSNLQLMQRLIHSVKSDFIRTELFGNPLILSFEPATTTNAQLHQMIKDKVREFIEYDETLSAERIEEIQYHIRLVSSSGNSCGTCPHSEGCVGCEFLKDDSLVNLNPSKQSLSIDWNLEDSSIFFSQNRVSKYIIEDISLCPSPEESKVKRVSLDDCMQLFNTEEKLSSENKWLCPKCNQWSEATKKLDLWRLPEMLVIHLKRFQYTSVFRDKLNELVEFPLELDMSPYVANQQEQERGANYTLYAVSNHIGGLGSGHYTCFAKNPENGKWYEYNDMATREVDEHKIVTSSTYILFYARAPPKMFDFIEEFKKKKLSDAIEQAVAEQINAASKSQDAPTDPKKDFPSEPSSLIDEDLALALRLSEEMQKNESQRKPKIEDMQKHSKDEHREAGNVKGAEYDTPSGRRMDAQNTADQWKQGSVYVCQYCEAPIDGGWEEAQIHVLTACESFQKFEAAAAASDGPVGDDGAQSDQDEPELEKEPMEPVTDFSSSYIN